MLEDDGTNPFGDPRGEPDESDWNTPAWREAMAEKYADPHQP